MATEKKSVVKEARVSEFNGKKSYSATMEDETSGYYDFKQCGELVKGELVGYTVEEKTNKKGGKYNLLTVTKLSGAVAQSEAVTTPANEPKLGLAPSTMEWRSAKNIIDMKFEARLHLIELITRLLVAGKIEFTEVKTYYTEWVIMVDTAIDELK
uniref:Uncharacterized protein n=1 Tax=viral metagenome TaxID=1070528 RepID=A0A6M3LRL1_9ZZZZ